MVSKTNEFVFMSSFAAILTACCNALGTWGDRNLENPSTVVGDLADLVSNHHHRIFYLEGVGTSSTVVDKVLGGKECGRRLGPDAKSSQVLRALASMPRSEERIVC
jgi:hypothetical protein